MDPRLLSALELRWSLQVRGWYDNDDNDDNDENDDSGEANDDDVDDDDDGDDDNDLTTWYDEEIW